MNGKLAFGRCNTYFDDDFLFLIVFHAVVLCNVMGTDQFDVSTVIKDAFLNKPCLFLVYNDEHQSGTFMLLLYSEHSAPHPPTPAWMHRGNAARSAGLLLARRRALLQL